MNFEKRDLLVLVIIVVASSAASFAMYFAMVRDVSPDGGPDPYFSIGLPILLVVVFSFFTGIFGLPLLFNPRHRSSGAYLSVGGLLFFATFLLVQWILPDARMEAFLKLGQRLMPLVEAIEQYKSIKGDYPENLDDLIPEHLEELPSTGMANYDEYQYYVGEDAEKDFGGNPWVLYVYAGYGMGFDRFFYFPLQNYPERGYGGRIEVLGRWAYAHE